MNPTYDFNGQVALVTGASSGMGLATAEAFSDSGAAVVLADINEKALQTVAEKLTSAGRKALGTEEKFETSVSPRIGIRHNADWPMRFYIAGNTSVSRFQSSGKPGR